MREIADGTYDCIVVDAELRDDGTSRVEIAITRGALKGETLSLRASQSRRDPIELLGLPATLIVRDGTPSITW